MEILKFVFSKDGLASLGISLFCGIFGGMIPYSFDSKSLALGLIISAICSFLGALFKESRDFTPNKDYFYVPYLIGGVIALAVTVIMWSCV